MKLVIEDDEGNRQEIPVDGLDEVTLGRAPGNTVQLPERNVSRRHARIFTENGALLVEDLKSANGVLLNGQKVTSPRPLQDGDLLRIGDYGVVLQHDTDIHRIQVVEAADTVESPVADVHDTAPHAVATLVAEAQPRLLALNGRLKGTVWTLGRSEVRIGKDDQAELSIPQRSLADFHAKLVQTADNDWRVQELAQAGVRVNGVAYADSPLRDGDVLELGALRLRFIGPGEPTPQLSRRSRSRLPVLILALAAVALLAFFSVRRLGNGPSAPSAPATAQREEPVLEVAPETVAPAPTETAAPPPPVVAAPTDALSLARASIQARDYPHALQHLNAVKDPRHAAEVSALRKTARAEAAAGRAVAAAQREMDAGRPGAALRQLKGAHGTRAWALEAEVLRARAMEAMKPKPARKAAPRETPAGEAQGWYMEGRRFYDAGRLTEAVGAFTQCLEKEADFARCHLMLGASYDKLGQMDDAERHYRRFLALTPANDPEVPRVKKVLEDSENQKKATGQDPPR
jgi:ABC transport system ATP-binding/permease protein